MEVLGRHEKGQLLRIRASTGETWQEAARRALRSLGLSDVVFSLKTERRKVIKVGSQATHSGPVPAAAPPGPTVPAAAPPQAGQGHTQWTHCPH